MEIKNYDSPQQYRERKFKNKKSKEEQPKNDIINNTIEKNSSSIDNTTNIPTLEEYYKKYGENRKEENLKSDTQLIREANAKNNRNYKNRTNIINVISIMWMFI